MLLKKFLLLLPAVALPLSSVADEGAPQAPGVLEEIVVSEFRMQSALEVNSSLSALDELTIESAAVQHFEELVSLIPNMNLSGEGSRARYFQLRGIGELEQYEGAPNPSVGYIIDDIDLSGVGGIGSLFDLQQVEVLRGPQATRYGANAIAGLVYVQSREPQDQTGISAELTAAEGDTLAAGVAVGGALGEAVSGRFSLHRYASDGFYDNVFLGVDDTNERDELVARGKLAWQLDGGWNIKLSTLYSDFSNGYDSWSPENGRTTFTDDPGRDEQETAGASLKISGPLNAATDFVSITGYAHSDILFSFDGEWGNAEYWAPYGYDYIFSDARERDSLTQELRLLSSPQGRILGGRSDWLLGVYVQRLDESNDIRSSGIYDDTVDAPFSYCPPCIDSNRLESAYDSTNYALFGKLDSVINERLSWSLGMRVERWSADYNDRYTDEIYGDPDQPVSNAFNPSKTLWGGDLSLDYQLSEQARWYGLLSRGYKAGGFNPSLARALGPDAALGMEAVAFDPEALWNLETGVKGVWLDGLLKAEFSLFYMDRDDMQLRSSAQFTNNPNDFVFITSNAEGHSYGLEASMDWQLHPAWALHANVGLLQSEVDGYPLEREVDIPGELVGRDFAHAPPYTLNLGATYSGPAGWMARVDYNATGSFYYDYSHDEKAASRQLVNLRVGKQWQQFAVYAWVRNLFDEDYHTRGFSFGLEPPFFARTTYTRLGDPRQVGLTVKFTY